MNNNKTIGEILKFLFYNAKELISNNITLFLILNIIHLFIILFFALINELLYNNIDVFQLSPGILLLRFSLFALMVGTYIGYFKILFNFIDGKKIQGNHLIKYFYLLPQLLFFRLLSYVTILPIIWYLLRIFPYNLEQYGTNYEKYLFDLMERLSSGLSIESIIDMYQGLTGSMSIAVIMILLLIPIWYTIRFWVAEFLVIDQEYKIKDALICSYKITQNYIQLVCLSLILIIWSLFTIVFGIIIFIFGLTISYLLIILYYRFLLRNLK